MSDLREELNCEINIDDIDLKPEEDEQTIEMENFFLSGVRDIEEFDRKAWSKGKGMTLPSFPQITEALEGLDGGLYLFSGRPNHGKSAAMMALASDIASYEPNKAFILYFSLDDPRDAIIPRLVAMDQSIPISVVAKPERFKEMVDNSEENSLLYQDWLDKRALGLDRLKNKTNHIKIEDSEKIKNTDDMYKYIKMVNTFIKSIDPKYNLVICIDSINDLDLPYRTTDNDRLSQVAKTVKSWTVEFDCPIFASTHTKKLNTNRRPTLDDLKDSIVLTYEASVVFIVYNDVSENKHGANVFYLNSNNEKYPIIEINWAKNKKSSFKGLTFCYFTPECSALTECPKDTMTRYSAIVYQS